MVATLGHRRQLCFWGWGYEDAGLSEAEQTHVVNLATQLAQPPRRVPLRSWMSLNCARRV